MKLTPIEVKKFPVWGDADHTVINMRVMFSEIAELGFLDFSANPNDTEEHGRKLFEDASSGVFGEVSPYVAPPECLPIAVSAKQIRYALNKWGFRDVFEEWIKTQDYQSRDYWEYETEIKPRDPVFMNWIKGFNTPIEVLDAIFIGAAKL